MTTRPRPTSTHTQETPSPGVVTGGMRLTDTDRGKSGQPSSRERADAPKPGQGGLCVPRVWPHGGVDVSNKIVVVLKIRELRAAEREMSLRTCDFPDLVPQHLPPRLNEEQYTTSEREKSVECSDGSFWASRTFLQGCFNQYINIFLRPYIL